MSEASIYDSIRSRDMDEVIKKFKDQAEEMQKKGGSQNEGGDQEDDMEANDKY